MKFLVVGASAYLGRFCYDYLLSKGYSVVGTQYQARLPGLVTFDLLRDNIKGVLDDSFLEEKGGKEPKFGIIFSAFSQVERCFREKEESYALNVEATIRLLHDFVALGIIPVYISSSAVYGGTTGNYTEEHPPQPQTEYGRQKLAVENYIKAHMPQALIFRIDKAVSHSAAPRNMFYEWQQLWEKGQPIPCLEQVFSPTSVEDIAAAILVSCEKKLQGTFNVANPESFSREELVRQFFSAWGKEAVIRQVSQSELHFSEARPAKTSLNSTKFIKATNFSFTPMSQVFDRFHESSRSRKASTEVEGCR